MLGLALIDLVRERTASLVLLREPRVMFTDITSLGFLCLGVAADEEMLIEDSGARGSWEEGNASVGMPLGLRGDKSAQDFFVGNEGVAWGLPSQSRLRDGSALGGSLNLVGLDSWESTFKSRKV